MQSMQIQRDLCPLFVRQESLPPRQYPCTNDAQTNSPAPIPAPRFPIRDIIRHSAPPLIPTQRLPKQLQPLPDNPTRTIPPLDRDLPVPVLRFPREPSRTCAVASAPAIGRFRKAFVAVRTELEERGSVADVEGREGCSSRKSGEEGGRTKSKPAGPTRTREIGARLLERGVGTCATRTGEDDSRSSSRTEFDGTGEASPRGINVRVSGDFVVREELRLVLLRLELLLLVLVWVADLLLLIRWSTSSARSLSQSREIKIGPFVSILFFVVALGLVHPGSRTMSRSTFKVGSHNLEKNGKVSHLDSNQTKKKKKVH